MTPVQMITLPFKEWEAKCNGIDAYSNLAPAMLSASALREERLQRRLDQALATPGAPPNSAESIARLRELLANDKFAIFQGEWITKEWGEKHYGDDAEGEFASLCTPELVKYLLQRPVMNPAPGVSEPRKKLTKADRMVRIKKMATPNSDAKIRINTRTGPEYITAKVVVCTNLYLLYIDPAAWGETLQASLRDVVAINDVLVD